MGEGNYRDISDRATAAPQGGAQETRDRTARELVTERLRMGPLQPVHAEVLHQLCVDPEVRRYLFADRVIELAQVQDMISASERCFQTYGTGFYAVFVNLANHPLDGQFAGFCGVRLFADGHGAERSFADRSLEMLVGVNPNIWGRGFGVEAARAVMRDAFERCGVEYLLAAADTPNQRSIRVLQKLGMSFRERRQWHGLDTMFYEITAAEFLQREAKFRPPHEQYASRET